MSSDIPALVFEDAPEAPVEHVNFGLYGRPGVGKSSAAVTAPGPILYVNAEGSNALAFPRKIAAERGAVIAEVRLDERSDVAEVLRGVVAHVRGGHEPVVQTVVVDTVGKIRDLLASHMVDQASKKSMQQWQAVTKIIRGFVQTLRDEPVNLVLLAHEDRVESDDAPTEIRPGFGGALAEQLTRELDVLAYLGRVPATEDAPEQFVGQLAPANQRIAKDRSNGLGRTRPVDLSEWIDAFAAALTPDTSDLPWSDPDPNAGGPPDADDAQGPSAETPPRAARRGGARRQPDAAPEKGGAGEAQQQALEGAEA